MALSNYPDNVTGNEPEIAGYPETDLHGMECRGGWVDTPDGPDSCDWEGDVDAATVICDTAYWHCPRCGTENEYVFEDPNDEYEPDWDRYDYDRD